MTRQKIAVQRLAKAIDGCSSSIWFQHQRQNMLSRCPQRKIDLLLWCSIHRYLAGVWNTKLMISRLQIECLYCPRLRSCLFFELLQISAIFQSPNSLKSMTPLTARWWCYLNPQMESLNPMSKQELVGIALLRNLLSDHRVHNKTNV